MNPKIKILKPVKWGINQPGPDILYFTEDMIGDELVHDDVSDDVAEKMQDAGYIKILESEDDENPGGGSDDIRATLQAIADGAENKNQAKDLLEEWSLKNLTFDVDKRKSLDDVINAIVAEHGNQGQD